VARKKKSDEAAKGGRADLQMQETDELRAKMIKIIRAYGLPVGFARQEADGYYGLLVNEDGTVTPFGYAKQDKFLDKTLEDLDPLKLAFLVWEGSRGVSLSDLCEEHGWGGGEDI
jgi:hypothetical protein